MLIALSTLGTAWLSLVQFAGQNNISNICQIYLLTTTQGINQYTNTATSSDNQPFFLLNIAFYEAVPGYIASTAANLISLITIVFNSGTSSGPPLI